MCRAAGAGPQSNGDIIFPFLLAVSSQALTPHSPWDFCRSQQGSVAAHNTDPGGCDSFSWRKKLCLTLPLK